MRPEDLFISGIVGWEVMASMNAEIPPPSAVLRRYPLWARWLFAGVLAGAVIVHLDAVPNWEAHQ